MTHRASKDTPLPSLSTITLVLAPEFIEIRCVAQVPLSSICWFSAKKSFSNLRHIKTYNQQKIPQQPLSCLHDIITRYFVHTICSCMSISIRPIDQYLTKENRVTKHRLLPVYCRNYVNTWVPMSSSSSTWLSWVIRMLAFNWFLQTQQTLRKLQLFA